jgi:HSP20 family protein
MVITRVQPISELFSPVFEDMVLPLRRLSGTTTRLPDADVIETRDHIRVLVELPGMAVEDIDLSMEKNVLTISGDKRARYDSEDDGRTYHLSERRWGRFTRSFHLPREVEQDGIEAHFEDGVLTIDIPKAEQARRRRIEIRNGHARQIEAMVSR